MTPWEGDASDGRLEDTVDFLEMLAFSRLSDLRPLIKQFSGNHFPEAFDEIQERQFVSSQKAKEQSLQTRIARLFSVSSGGRGADSKSTLTYWDRKTERKTKRREEYERIKALMQKQLQLEMQREKEYYAQHKMSVVDLLSKGAPPPPPPATISTGNQ